MGVIPGIAKPKALRFASAEKGAENEHLSLAELKASGEIDRSLRASGVSSVRDILDTSYSTSRSSPV